MENRVILITGAGNGIGLACVKQFLERGWKVIAHHRRPSRGLRILQKSKGKADLLLLRCDFHNVLQVKKFIENIKRKELDALVNNAAMYDLSVPSKNRIKTFQAIALVNMIVPALLSEAVLAMMRKRGKGHIVNISSIASKYGSPMKNVFYGMSKSGLEALTRSLAREGAPYNILVNTVRPGLTDTALLKRIGKDIKQRKKMIPLRRLATPQEVADLIYYLIAKNTFVTNEIVSIAGGE